MFQFNKNYILIPILIFGLSGCTEPRVITINTYDMQRNIPRREVIHRRVPPREERIKEEILIRNNPHLGNSVERKVAVPKNRPTLGIRRTIDSSRVERTTQPQSSELNGETMQRMDFPTEEYMALQHNGSSTVSGTVYLKNSLNDEKIVRRNLKLYLNPVTSYSKQWYQQSYLGGYKMSRPDRRLYNYLKFTTTDSSGNFSFYEVPVGEYYLGAKINCSSECGYDTTKIIRVVKEISVGYGTTDVELTKIVP
jgi:hypothetical protein